MPRRERSVFWRASAAEPASRRPEPSGAAAAGWGCGWGGAARRHRQRRLRRLGADRRAAGHLAQAGARPVLGAEEAAVLLGERVRDRAGRDEAEVDEHLPERRAAAVLLREGVQKLVFRQEALVDHDLAELTPGVGCRIHQSLIGRRRGGLKGLTHARPPASRARRRASGRRSRPSGSRARARRRARRRATARRRSTTPTSATFQAMNASMPSRPSSTPSSVYVDSPALISRPVRFAVTPALPTP